MGCTPTSLYTLQHTPLAIANAHRSLSVLRRSMSLTFLRLVSFPPLAGILLCFPFLFFRTCLEDQARMSAAHPFFLLFSCSLPLLALYQNPLVRYVVFTWDIWLPPTCSSTSHSASLWDELPRLTPHELLLCFLLDHVYYPV